MRLRRLKQSLVTALTSADLRREVDSVLPCLPRLKLSRRVRFTNRFTEPAPDLRIPAAPAGARQAPCTVVPYARHRRRTCHRPGDRAWRYPAPPPNPTAAEPDGRRVLSRVGVADHEVTPEAPWTGSGWREYSYGGFGGGHPSFHRHGRAADTPNLVNLGLSAWESVPYWPLRSVTCGVGCPRVTVRDRSSPGLMAR